MRDASRRGRIVRLRRWCTPLLGSAALGILPQLLPPIELPNLPGGGQQRDGSGVRVASTGPNAELVERVAIRRSARAGRQVVMSLGPKELGKLRRGHRLRASAEVQVSTTCVDRSRRCVGRRYGFNPRVSARLVLARGRDAVSGRRTINLSPRKSVRCNQKRPDRNHHCTLVLRHAGRTVRDPGKLPCDPKRCRVNLVLSATHPKARRGHVVVLGGDRPDGSVVQNKGRVNAVVVRRDAGATLEELQTDTRVNRRLPLAKQGAADRRVVYSLPLGGLRRGDKLVAEARGKVQTGHVGTSVLLSSSLVLAESQDATSPSREVRRSTSFGGRLTETNGFNCTKGPSGYQTPCVVRKVGVIGIRRNPPAPLYLNLVSRGLPLLAPVKAGAHARVRRDGHLAAGIYRR